MGTVKFTVPDEVEERFREWPMKRFGHKRGALGKAGEEALIEWIAEQDVEFEPALAPARSPITSKRGALGHVEASSSELEHAVGDRLRERHRDRRDDE